MIKTCKNCSENFEITDDDLKFYEDIGPDFNGKKYPISAPNLCPKCREINRLQFRNLKNLYKRKCDFSGKEIISGYSEKIISPIYHASIWWSDKWDPMDHGMDLDLNRSFFEQFKELFEKVPLLHLYWVNNENCEYINGAANCKNCYLSFNIDQCESMYYVTNAQKSQFCFDCYSIFGCELCFQCVDCENCYNLFYSERSSSCSDSYFLIDCKRCKDCIGCVNLIDKQYCIFNEQFSKDEYEKKKNQILNERNYEEIHIDILKKSLAFPKKYYYGHSNESFSGNNIRNAKNSYACFESYEIENCKYCDYIFHAKNCMDYNIFGNHSEWIYNSIATGINCSNNICCMGCWQSSSNNFYCNMINGCTNCFGCSGLKKKNYCILNKQYTKEEYEILVPKIIQKMIENDEWGEFFPKELSPFSFEESIASDYYPEQKNEHIVKAGKETDGCIECGKHFKVIQQEENFYNKNNLSLPKKCPKCRDKARMKLRNPKKLWTRACSKCGTGIQTSYSSDRPETVYCEACYLASVY